MIAPRSASTLHRTTSWAPRSWCSCMRPSSLGVEARDELMISSLSTWTIPRSIHWSSHRVDKSWDAISVAGSRRHSQRTNNLRFANCGSLSWSFQVDFQHLVAVSWTVTHITSLQFPATSLTQECLHSSLENTLLGFDFCFAPVSWCFLTQTLNPAARVASGSVGFLKSKQVDLRYRRLFSRLLSRILFDMVLAFSIERKWLRENKEKIDDVKQTKKIAPFITRKTSSGQQVSELVFWCQHIWFGFCFGSKLILSNNQFNATLLVLDTCLIIGLRPLMIILITTSLSSKMYNWDPPSEECVFAGT